MFALEDDLYGLVAAASLPDARLDEAEVTLVTRSYLGERLLPIDKFSSWSNSSSSLSALSLIIITIMDLTPEQVDQIVALELRKLERDYQQTIAADHRMEDLVIPEGTPNLDAIVAETLAKQQDMISSKGKDEAFVKTSQTKEDEEWETDEENEEEENAGFQRLPDEEDAEEFPPKADDESAVENEKRPDGPQKPEISDNIDSKAEKKQLIFEEVVIQERKKAEIDHKKVQEAMSKINFPAPEWAKK